MEILARKYPFRRNETSLLDLEKETLFIILLFHHITYFLCTNVPSIFPKLSKFFHSSPSYHTFHFPSLQNLTDGKIDSKSSIQGTRSFIETVRWSLMIIFRWNQLSLIFIDSNHRPSSRNKARLIKAPIFRLFLRSCVNRSCVSPLPSPATPLANKLLWPRAIAAKAFKLLEV